MLFEEAMDLLGCAVWVEEGCYWSRAGLWPHPISCLLSLASSVWRKKCDEQVPCSCFDCESHVSCRFPHTFSARLRKHLPSSSVCSQVFVLLICLSVLSCRNVILRIFKCSFVLLKFVTRFL